MGRGIRNPGESIAQSPLPALVVARMDLPGRSPCILACALYDAMSRSTTWTHRIKSQSGRHRSLAGSDLTNVVLDLVRFAAGHVEGQRVAFGVRAEVDFRREAAARATERLGRQETRSMQSIPRSSGRTTMQPA